MMLQSCCKLLRAGSEVFNVKGVGLGFGLDFSAGKSFFVDLPFYSTPLFFLKFKSTEVTFIRSTPTCFQLVIYFI